MCEIFQYSRMRWKQNGSKMCESHVKCVFVIVEVILHSHFQSQDYDQCENTLFMKEQEKEKKVCLVVIIIY